MLVTLLWNYPFVFQKLVIELFFSKTIGTAYFSIINTAVWRYWFFARLCYNTTI